MNTNIRPDSSGLKKRWWRWRWWRWWRWWRVTRREPHEKTKIEKHLKTCWSLKLQKLRFHMKNKLKTSKQGKLGKTNLKLQNKGHGGWGKMQKIEEGLRGYIQSLQNWPPSIFLHFFLNPPCPLFCNFKLVFPSFPCFDVLSLFFIWNRSFWSFKLQKVFRCFSIFVFFLYVFFIF